MIWQAQVLPNEIHHGTIGQVVAMDGETIDVVTGDGLLRIEEWEVSGDKPIRMHSVLGSN